MATIEDVAKLAGLSRTTVSRVINNHPYVSDKKRKQVLDAMSELRYVPNSSARSLRNQKTSIIALLIPRVMNPFFSQLVEFMEMEAAKHGYQVIVCQTKYSEQKELEYLDLLKTRQVDGIILTSIQNDWKLIEPYLHYGPIVLCNEFDDCANVPTVKLNQKYGGYIATKHLLEQGHHRIAYCTGGYRSNVSKGREEGFRQALLEHGVKFNEHFTFNNAFTIEDGRRIVNEIVKWKDRPTAIFTGGDEVAAGIISEAKCIGYNIPEDLAVVGFDNQAISNLLDPTITTVHQPVDLMAEKTVSILMEKLRTKRYNQQEVYEFDLQLIVRDSTVKQGVTI
ncbi:LacI family DNA-binding transcriptional regulator [Sutcliffiella cohnii]|uniref:LacI family transcriptional regulator n=1 Tax=Sutcliffiella cohnii TaxID=33932 RepID=A0A223KM90_9BACI|nr:MULTISPECIES: LacI family DNA-binding transcriptional regulator [Sutcliffiella]AST90507.1 LacI family transcriptional regulator [Sutcliffiella cohnii]MED4016787.1 LacI family DNA-binding transcriptional regulator [Sutcliffiella cohnii]WBL16158.1 LacI family DNA-binding transcriptional regulator [Sutcliffiella sp. NC1]